MQRFASRNLRPGYGSEHVEADAVLVRQGF